jgi:hypothetical protein
MSTAALRSFISASVLPAFAVFVSLRRCLSLSASPRQHKPHTPSGSLWAKGTSPLRFDELMAPCLGGLKASRCLWHSGQTLGVAGAELAVGAEGAPWLSLGLWPRGGSGEPALGSAALSFVLIASVRRSEGETGRLVTLSWRSPGPGLEWPCPPFTTLPLSWPCWRAVIVPAQTVCPKDSERHGRPSSANPSSRKPSMDYGPEPTRK